MAATLLLIDEDMASIVVEDIGATIELLDMQTATMTLDNLP